ncbi:GAF domain-containing protein [bacterium]|nr:GAF domain-containing protein [bacterium]
MFSEVLREQKTVLLHHSPTDAAWGSLPEYGHIQSWIGVPLITHRVTMGILAISSVLPDFYSTEDSAQLRAFANQIALAIENAQLFEQAQQEITDRKRPKKRRAAATGN